MENVAVTAQRATACRRCDTEKHQDRARRSAYIDRTELSPVLITQFVRLAAFQNPEFYRAQAMRLPTFGKPRIISCAELYAQHIGLPRGCLDDAIDLIKGYGAVVNLEDQREIGGQVEGRSAR